MTGFRYKLLEQTDLYDPQQVLRLGSRRLVVNGVPIEGSLGHRVDEFPRRDCRLRTDENSSQNVGVLWSRLMVSRLTRRSP